MSTGTTEHPKKKYKLTFIREEYLHVELYANDEDQAYEMASDLDYEDFETGDTSLDYLYAEEVEE